MPSLSKERPIALVTGASRTIGIGAAIAVALAESGWDVTITYWRPYDATMPWGSRSGEADAVLDQVQRLPRRRSHSRPTCLIRLRPRTSSIRSSRRWGR